MDPIVASIERAALLAWPASEVQPLGEWRLRAMAGVTRRANSVWTGGDGARPQALALERRVEQVEEFYRERGLPSRFQLSPLSTANLDGVLVARGYALEAPVSVQTARAADVVRRCDSGRSVQVESRLFESWFELSGRGGRFVGREEVYRGLLERLGDRALFAEAAHEGEPASVGLGVVEGDYCGVFSMLTAVAHRKKGLGRAVLAALSRAALERGASEIYLQLERDNTVAHGLYAHAGFRELYGYAYRVRRETENGLALDAAGTFEDGTPIRRGAGARNGVARERYRDRVPAPPLLSQRQWSHGRRVRPAKH